MKRIIALILSVISVLILSSCGQKADNGETTVGSAAVPESTEAEHKLEPQYDYDLTPYVKLGEYKNLDVDFVDERIIDTELQQEIDNRLINNNYFTEEKLDKKTVEDGDWLNIDYEGTIDGEKFDGGSAEGAELHIGSGSFIEGFESGLVGKEVGNTVSLDLKFPEEYAVRPEFSGKAVVFKVKINYIFEKAPKELTGELVEELTSGMFNSVEQYKAYIAEYMQNEKINKNKNAVLNKAVENATIIEYPAEEIKNYIDLAMRTYEEIAANQSMDLDEYIESLGQTREEFEADINKKAEEAIKTELVVFAIAKAENIVVDEERYNVMANSFAGSSGADLKTIEDKIGSGRVLRMVMQNDVVSFLYEHAAQYMPPETTTQQ